MIRSFDTYRIALDPADDEPGPWMHAVLDRVRVTVPHDVTDRHFFDAVVDIIDDTPVPADEFYLGRTCDLVRWLRNQLDAERVVA